MTTGPKAQQHAHIATLDLLRLAAAVAVVFYHFLFRGATSEGFMAESYPGAAPLAIYGYIGVHLFFLISGFVIAWSAEGRNWDQFAIARFARLYPGFLVCMTMTFVFLALSGSTVFPVSLRQYAANLSMFAPAFGQPFMDGAYWSIVLEIIFYGWVALALFAGVFNRYRLQLVAGWLLVAAINEYGFENGAARILFVTEFAPLFAAGILVHHLHSKGRSLPALLLLLVTFPMSFAAMLQGRLWMVENYGTGVPIAGLLVADIAIYALLIGAVRFRSLVKVSPVVIALGGITYPLYLLHQHIGYVAIDALAPSVGKWPAAGIVVVALLVVSWLVWRVVEIPARKRIIAALTRLAARVNWHRAEPGLGRTPA